MILAEESTKQPPGKTTRPKMDIVAQWAVLDDIREFDIMFLEFAEGKPVIEEIKYCLNRLSLWCGLPTMEILDFLEHHHFESVRVRAAKLADAAERGSVERGRKS